MLRRLPYVSLVLNVRSLSLITQTSLGLRSLTYLFLCTPSPSLVCVVFPCFFQSSGRQVSATSTDLGLVSIWLIAPSRSQLYICLRRPPSRGDEMSPSCQPANVVLPSPRWDSKPSGVIFGKLSLRHPRTELFFLPRTNLTAYSEVCGPPQLGSVDSEASVWAPNSK